MNVNEGTPSCSGLRKRKRDVDDENKRPLTSAELEACLNDSEESDFEFSSDDDKDRSFNPDREESSSESEENVEYSSLDDISRNVRTPEVPTTTEAENIEESWTDIEVDPTEFPFAGAKKIRISDLPLNPDPLDYFGLFF
ncbi:uncharacterized protein LOC126745523 [Anthonomus grandis grandis]|uniref:uncharacterized protein LOC126745523 n=1 Tax=Anthonomus grandis grandis TaxID=2921223 RepID=UPI002165864D|nr:uncharacterized protein LOC126745523 [Anthonomus grandis grandis]